MTEQNAQPDVESWGEALERYLEHAGDDLGARFAPTVKALRAIAAELDAAEGYSSTLAAEYGRMHRWLLNKTGAVKSSGVEDGPDLLDMLAQNPGALWTP